MDASLGGELHRRVEKESLRPRYKRKCCKKWRKGKLCARCPQRAVLTVDGIRRLLERAAASRTGKPSKVVDNAPRLAP